MRCTSRPFSWHTHRGSNARAIRKLFDSYVLRNRGTTAPFFLTVVIFVPASLGGVLLQTHLQY